MGEVHDRFGSQDRARPVTQPAADQRTWSSPKCWLVLVVVMAVGLSADLITKQWAFDSVAGTPVVVSRHALIENPGFNPIPPHQSVVVIPGRLLNLHLVLNSGAVFGIGSEQRGFFIGFTLVAIVVALYIFGWQTRRSSLMAHVGIGLVMAGALGNLWDRLAIGRVRDFLHMFPDRHLPFGLQWPGGGSEVFPWIFNIADVLLLCGMGILLIHLHLADRREQRLQQASANPSKSES